MNRVPKLRFKEFSEEWQEKRLEETINNEIKWSFTGGPFGSDLKSEDYTLEGIRVIQLQNIGDGKFINDNKIYTSIKKANNLISCNIYPNDILMSKMGDPVARALIVPNYENRYLMCSDGIRLVPDSNFYNNLFLMENINNKNFRKKAENASTGSTRKRIGLTELRKLTLNIPCLKEQEKIGNFLSSVDKKISITEEKLDLFKDYKKGIMQKIFNQELRFKDSNGNDYPEWEEKKLGELPIYISDGNYGELYPKQEELLEQGVPFIRVNNLKDSKINFKEMKYISKELHQILLSGHLIESDILVCTRGEIGIVAYVDSKFNGANINAQLCLLRIKDKNIITPYFLLHLLNSYNIQKQFKELQTGSALKQLPKKNLNKLVFNIPCLEEQQKIANFLSSIDNKIDNLTSELENLKEFKKGLLQQMFV